MIKYELKSNLKTFIIFLMIIVFLLFGVSLIYPSLMSSVNIDEMIKAMPEEFIGAFNMDIASIQSVFGWFATEGYMMITLLGGCYFTMLGGTIVLKENDNKTIEYLYSKPISKNKILNSKIISALIYLVIFNVVVSLTMLLGLLINNDLNVTKWLLLSIGPLFLELFMFFISLFISLFLKKTSTSISIGVGVVFISYLLNVISGLSSDVEFLKYLSVFYYMDSRDIIVNSSIDIINILIVVGVSLLFMLFTYKRYNKKELGL